MGLQPVTAGLLMASAGLLIASTTVDWAAGVVTGVAAVLFLFSRLHPLLILGGAAALGVLGVVG